MESAEMMNAHERAIRLGLTGSDAEIAAKLSSITASPIRLDYLLEMLNFRGMLRKTDGSQGQERWVGTLQNLKAVLVSQGLTAKVYAYEMWFSHVTNPRQINWDTRFPQWAVPFLEMEQAFAGLTITLNGVEIQMPSVEDFAAVVGLGGGRPHAGLTEQQYVAARNAYNLELDVAAVRELCDNAARGAATQQNATLSSIKQAVVAALEE